MSHPQTWQQSTQTLLMLWVRQQLSLAAMQGPLRVREGPPHWAELLPVTAKGLWLLETGHYAAASHKLVGLGSSGRTCSALMVIGPLRTREMQQLQQMGMVGLVPNQPQRLQILAWDSAWDWMLDWMAQKT